MIVDRQADKAYTGYKMLEYLDRYHLIKDRSLIQLQY